MCTANKCAKTCSVHGTGHFRTFDGKEYDFTSQCEYTLMETMATGLVMPGETFNDIPLVTITRKSFIDTEHVQQMNEIPLTYIHVQVGSNQIDLREVRTAAADKVIIIIIII